MYVIGNAEEAEGLADECLKRVKEIYEETRQLQFELKKLQESFQDNGIEEVNDTTFLPSSGINFFSVSLHIASIHFVLP